MKKLSIGFLAIALIAGLFMGSAHAGVFAPLAPAPGPAASEIFGGGSAATPIPTVPAPLAQYTLASAPGTGASFMIEYTLGGGATFATALTAADLIYNGWGAVTALVVDGGQVGDNWVQFRVDVTWPLTAGETFDLRFNVNNAQSLGTPGAVIPLNINIYDNLGPVDTAGQINVLTSAQGTDQVIAPTAAAGTLFIDVATGSVNFGGTSPDIINATTVNIGNLTVNDVGGTVGENLIAPWATGAGDATTQGAEIVITGEFAACVNPPGDVTVGAFSARAIGTITPTEVRIPLTNAQLAGIIGAAQPVTYIADGVTPIGESTPNLSCYITFANGTYQLDMESGDLRVLRRNGTTVYPGIVIGSGYGYDGGFRFVNRSTLAANIYFQVQNYNGAMLPQVAWSGNPVPAGGTVYIPTDTVLTEGGLGTTSSANGILTIESPDADIYQISYHSGGFTIVPLTKSNNQAYPNQ